jgi:type III HopA1-like effector protein
MPRSASARAALERACALVERDDHGWTVGGSPADDLAAALYIGWYTRPSSRGRDDAVVVPGSLRLALRAAHAAARERDSGWAVTASSPRGVVAAARGDSARLLRPGEYAMPLRPGVPPAPGEPIEPVRRLDHLDDDQALWWSFTDPPPERPLGRVYLNARPATAARAVHELTHALAGIPHQLKCPQQAQACERIDAIVAYHERPARDAVLASLDDRWPRLRPLLDPDVPPLTRRVRPGLAWADDVEDGQSYGESRCRLVAAAIERAAGAWPGAGPARRLELVQAGLREAGIDPERPWSAG